MTNKIINYIARQFNVNNWIFDQQGKKIDCIEEIQIYNDAVTIIGAKHIIRINVEVYNDRN